MKWLSILMVASLSAFGQSEPKMIKLRDQAESVASIGAFVDKYLGDCGILGTGECEKNAEAFRRAASGKKFYMIVNEGSANVLQMGEFTDRKGSFILNLTPFFPGSNSALTHGAPSRTDADGNAVVPFIRVESVLPDGWNPAMMSRQVSAQTLRIQLIFTPQDIWTLPKKGGGKLRGIKSKFEAVMVSVGRTGEKIGSWYAK
jgi:Family of unknown function (DUF6066)